MSELTKEQKIEKIKAANAKILAIINEEVMPHIEGNMHDVAKSLENHQYTAYPFSLILRAVMIVNIALYYTMIVFLKK